MDNSTKYELAVDLEDWSSNRRFARYRSFRLSDERDGFRLHHQVRIYFFTLLFCLFYAIFILRKQNLFYGNAGDALYSHNGLPFSTFDVDNDNREGEFSDRSCARLYKARIFRRQKFAKLPTF